MSAHTRAVSPINDLPPSGRPYDVSSGTFDLVIGEGFFLGSLI